MLPSNRLQTTSPPCSHPYGKQKRSYVYDTFKLFTNNQTHKDLIIVFSFLSQIRSCVNKCTYSALLFDVIFHMTSKTQHYNLCMLSIIGKWQFMNAFELPINLAPHEMTVARPKQRMCASGHITFSAHASMTSSSSRSASYRSLSIMETLGSSWLWCSFTRHSNPPSRYFWAFLLLWQNCAKQKQCINKQQCLKWPACCVLGPLKL